MVIQIQHRRASASAWTAANPTLASGELGYETDTRKMKIGDGTTAWVSLGYIDLGDLSYAPLASPSFTGTPLAPTASVGTSTTQIATTAFVQGSVVLTSGVDGAITYRTTSGWVSVAAGTSGYILETRDSGYAPVWIAPGVADATAIAYAIVFGG